MECNKVQDPRPNSALLGGHSTVDAGESSSTSPLVATFGLEGSPEAAMAFSNMDFTPSQEGRSQSSPKGVGFVIVVLQRGGPEVVPSACSHFGVWSLFGFFLLRTCAKEATIVLRFRLFNAAPDRRKATLLLT